MADFPHMRDTSFPDVENVNAYKYKNDFDYSKFDRTQMRITVCSVPWDVGLIHVGNAQIGGLGNVVYFQDADARDSYLDSIENKFTWETKYRAYHDDGYIEVPLPYERCVLFNYCYIEYDSMPIDWGASGENKFFFFIRSCEYLAPNTCKIEILRDTWQSYIYDVDINYLMLERGHAPLSLTDADTYLANPIENTQYLLADDVNYGGAMRSKYASNVVLNAENMQAVIVTSADLREDWGSAEGGFWRTPGDSIVKDGIPTYHAYALNPGILSAFLQYVKYNLSQFPQTVQGVFFISGDLLVFQGMQITIDEFSLREVAQQHRDFDLMQLTKSQFGYGERYQELAKLYTYPYAYLELSDENGDKTQVRIEETSGNLSLSVTTNLAYPFMKLNAHVEGVGSGDANIYFANADSHNLHIGGDWANLLYEWSIPSFAVIQDNADYYDFSTYYDREQRQFEADTAYTNAIANADAKLADAYNNADTALANAIASAKTTYDDAITSATNRKTNADANADATLANANDSADLAKANADASADIAKINADASADTGSANSKRSADATQSNSIEKAITRQTNANRNASTAKTIAENNALARKRVADIRTTTTASNNYASNAIAKSNSDASALTSYNNALSADATANANANASSETTYYNTINANDATSTIAGLQRDTANYIRTSADNAALAKLDASDLKLDSDLYADLALAAMMGALEADVAMATTTMNSAADAIGNTVQGALNGAIAGAAAGAPVMAMGALGGAASSALGSMASASLGMASLAITMTNNQSVLDAQEFAAVNKNNYAKRAARTITNQEISFQNAQIAYQNTLNRNSTDTGIAASNAAALAGHNTTVANANRTKETSDAIALNVYNTSIANSTRTKDTNDANTERTYNSEISTNVGASGEPGTNKIEYDNALTNADLEKTKADANALADYNTDVSTANRSRTADYSNADASNALAKENASRTQTTTKSNATRTQNVARNNAQRSYDAQKAINANDETTSKANASRDYTNALANAQRTHDNATGIAERHIELDYANADRSKDAALEGIANDIKQAALDAPKVFGETSNADTATSRPQGIFCNIVTQAQDAIEQTGDYFLRFGYAVNRAWDFTTFNLMPKFCYWKASDIWISGNNVPDKYLDEIRFYLLGGVCVWKNPDDIGNISIYENK